MVPRRVGQQRSQCLADPRRVQSERICLIDIDALHTTPGEVSHHEMKKMR